MKNLQPNTHYLLLENGVQEISFEFDDDGHIIHTIEKPEEPSQFNKSLIKALNYNLKDEEPPSE